VRIDNPIAVVDAYATRHRSNESARALIEFLREPQAQRVFARHGFRPVLDSVAAEVAASFPRVEDLFTVQDLGGWDAVRRDVFADGAAYDRALERGRR
jgi:sulfate transport system substrate-binding protein